MSPDDPAYEPGGEKDAVVAAAKWVSDNQPELDPVCGDEGYPTKIELTRVRSWFDGGEKLTRDRIITLAAYVRERWRYAEMGYWAENIDKDGVVFYQISTGGWSGNESLMAELRDTMFWFLCFESHFRGGHYTFTVKAWKESNATAQDA